jgi:anti-sigma factor RsiW
MSGLRCMWLRAAIVDFADGMLDEPARARVERHVSKCSDCADAVLALRETPAELTRLARTAHDEQFWVEQRRRIAEAIERGSVAQRFSVSRRPGGGSRHGPSTGSGRSPRAAIWWRAVPALGAAAVVALVIGRSRVSTTTPAPLSVASVPAESAPAAAAASSVTAEDTLTAFVEEPAALASIDVASLDETTAAGIDESLGESLAGYADGNLI